MGLSHAATAGASEIAVTDMAAIARVAIRIPTHRTALLPIVPSPTIRDELMDPYPLRAILHRIPMMATAAETVAATISTAFGRILHTTGANVVVHARPTTETDAIVAAAILVDEIPKRLRN